MSKKRILAHLIGVLVVVLALTYVGRRPGHISPYDANLVRLAETERQGYCAAVTFWNGGPNAGQAKECRTERREKSGRVNLIKAERGFCEGIVDQGWEGALGDCLTIMAQNQYWPTYDGNITQSWNRARPYPRPAIAGQGEQDDGSRTGERPGGHNRPSNPRASGY